MMQRALYTVGGLLLLLLGWAILNPSRTVGNGPAVPLSEANPSGWMAFSEVVGDRQQVTVIDPVRQTMVLYQIEPGTGKVQLKSVRNLRWDFDMYAFNTGDPQPQEIRTMLGR